MPHTHFDIDERRVSTITLDRDQKRNALSNELASELIGSIQRAVQEQSRVVILRANSGAKVWCAGHDLAELDPQDLHVENLTLKLADEMRAARCPVIAMVEGSVYAGGFILLLSADLVIAAPNASVAITSNKIGIPLPATLYAYWLRTMGMHKAKEMLFTAATISAQDAWQAGLYNHVVEADQLESFTDELVEKMLKSSPSEIANSKQQLNLIARQPGLSPAELQEIDAANDEILSSEDTQQRIRDLLLSLRQSG